MVRKRITAFTLCLLLILQIVIPIAASAKSGTESYSTQASHSGFVTLGGRTLRKIETISENGDGSFTLSLSLSSNIEKSDQNDNSQVARNNYFTVTQSGEYLIELWGGSGADGEDTTYSKGGHGGSGGHVYGVIHLNAGQTLYYTLGGNGVQTLNFDSGGGANGNGGNHGDIGSYMVGGGGGYSAVYLFESADFEEKYTDSLGNISSDIQETDRIQKYIMIAGGGGGGGAGNGFSLTGSATGLPDGGAGGSIGGNYGLLSGDGYDVAGTFFVGSDGKSSGTSVSYVGHGGTNLPGTPSDTLVSMFEVESPNDWKGTYNASTKGGAGGAGNMRGGGGGAGFCGGSGGIMTSIISATNVGGGGGGSSFVAETVSYSGLSESAESKLIHNNPSSTGGAINITYLGTETAPVEETIDISGTVSQYFDIAEVSASSGNVSSENGVFTVSESSLMLSSDGESSSVEISVVLRPKSGFAGGNNVPLLQGDTVSLTSGDDSAEIVLHQDCSAVNVALNFSVVTHSHVTNIEGYIYHVSELFTDNYAEIRDSLTDDIMFDFIQSIGSYTVTDSNGTILQPGDDITVRETAVYKVFFNVIPKTIEPATVGKPVSEQTFSSTATITFFSANSGEMNGNRLKYTKSLSYFSETGIYELSLEISSGTDSSYAEVSPLKIAYSSSQESLTAEAPASGYYMFQLWGGNGGKGNGSYGGAGGEGGYVCGIVHFEKGDVITATLGADGATPDIDRAGGPGGGYTSLTSGANLILVAGGGGGGGGYGGLFGLLNPGKAGESVSVTTDEPPSDLSDLSDYAGKDGGAGSLLDGGGSGGSAGVNYRRSDVLTDASSLSADAQDIFNLASESDYTHGSGGAIYITPLQLDSTAGSATEDVLSALSGYNLDVDLSQYFTVRDVTVENKDGTAVSAVTEVNGQQIKVSSINPLVNVTETVENETTTLHGSVDFIVKIRLYVRDGFLGGNDVPVLSYENSSNSTGMLLSQGSDSLQINRQGSVNPNDSNKSDFANVAINYTPNPDLLTVNTVTYVRGDAAIPHSLLFNYPGDGKIYTWEDDFVSFVDPNTSDLVHAPESTTLVPVEIGLRPLIAEPSKASVGETATESISTKYAVIEVKYRVIYDLGNIQTSHTPDENGRYIITPEQEYSAVLTADKGSLLPDRITVEIGGKILADTRYNYNPANGSLLIPASEVTDNITITAHSEMPEVYKIHYVYETKPGGEPVFEEFGYTAGSVISEKFSDTYEAEVFEGYEFVWDWGADEGITNMPEKDIWVTGTYVAVKYNLTVYYKDKEGNDLFPAYTETVEYGKPYSIKSPVKSGYMADILVAEGTVSGETVITVTYSPTSNRLNIVYILSDSNTVFDTVDEYYATDQSFAVTSPEKVGYTPDFRVVKGIMTAEGITVYVTYSPNSYTVTFDPSGGNCQETVKTVIYNNIYGFDGSSYAGLPVPVRPGYKFLGWYFGETKITEETRVTTASSHTLTAKWEVNKYTLVVRYLYENNLSAGEDKVLSIPYGGNFSVESPTIPGYTADKTIVSGIMPAQNTVITVVYLKNSYNLTVKYIYEDGSQAYPDETFEIARNTPYTLISPEVTGHTPDIKEISGTSLSEDETVTVTYYKNSYTLTIHYTLEDGSSVFDDFTMEVRYGENYSVNTPEYGNYVPSIPVVSGVMGAVSQEITVIYYPGELPEIISVDIEWGALTFKAEYDEWNPQTHKYDSVSVAPVTTGSNYLRMINRSNVSVNADFSFSVNAEYEKIFEGYFTASGTEPETPVLSDSILLGTGISDNSGAIWLWLREKTAGAVPESGANGTFTVGSCTVTITKAGE